MVWLKSLKYAGLLKELNLAGRIRSALLKKPDRPRRALAGETVSGCVLQLSLDNFKARFKENVPAGEALRVLAGLRKAAAACLDRFCQITINRGGPQITCVFLENILGADLFKQAWQAAVEAAGVLSERTLEEPDFKIINPQIGLSYGTVTLGIIRVRGYYAYTVLGRPAALARCLAEERLRLGASVLADQTCGLALPEAMPLALYRLPGPEVIYTLYGYSPVYKDLVSENIRPEYKSRFTEGLRLLHQSGAGRMAAGYFETCLKLIPGFEPARYYSRLNESAPHTSTIRGYRV